MHYVLVIFGLQTKKETAGTPPIRAEAIALASQARTSARSVQVKETKRLAVPRVSLPVKTVQGL